MGVHCSLTELGDTMAVKIVAVVLSLACSALADPGYLGGYGLAGHGYGLVGHGYGHGYGLGVAGHPGGYSYVNRSPQGLKGYHGHYVGKREAQPEPAYGHGLGYGLGYGYSHGPVGVYHGGLGASSLHNNNVWGLSSHRLGKREADADADAEAEPYHGYGLGYGHGYGLGYGHGYGYGHGSSSSFQSVSRPYEHYSVGVSHVVKGEAEPVHGYGLGYG